MVSKQISVNYLTNWITVYLILRDFPGFRDFSLPRPPEKIEKKMQKKRKKKEKKEKKKNVSP